MTEEELREVVGKYLEWKKLNYPSTKPNKIPSELRANLVRVVDFAGRPRVGELTGLSNSTLHRWHTGSKGTTLKKSNKAQKLGFLEVAPSSLPVPVREIKSGVALSTQKDVVILTSSKTSARYLAEMVREIF